jgi:hypothetical protein
MLGLTFLLPIAVINYLNPLPTSTTLDLQDAIKQGIVIATPISTGTYANESITLKLSNKVQRPLKLKVPAGMVYYPENEDNQTLIQLEDMDVIVSAGGTTQLTIDAYCMESSDGVPEGGSSFKIGKTTNQKLLALINQLKQSPVDAYAHQDAVWAITDNHELTYLPNQTEQDRSLREFLSTTTGQENKWYEVAQQRRVDVDRRIVIDPTLITGMLSFDCTPGKAITEEVRKMDGTVMLTHRTNFAPRSSQLKYKFNLTIKGWDKGEYYVVVKNDLKELARYDFSL